MKYFQKIKNIAFGKVGGVCAALLLAVIASAALTYNPEPVQAGGRCTNSCSYTITKGSTTYAVTGTANYNCRPWPSWGCDFIRNEIVQKLSPTNLSGSWGLGCGNIHSFSARVLETKKNGSCGSANGVATVNEPTTRLCNAGTVSNRHTFTDRYEWKCNGTGGGNDVDCSAPRATNNFGLSCSISPSAPRPGQQVTWTANSANGNISDYQLAWSGAVSGTTRTVSATFTTIGNHVEILTATKNGRSESVNCPVQITNTGTIGDTGDIDTPNSCGADQKFCTTLGKCIPKDQVCPNACAKPVVAVGGKVTESTANLCAPGFEPVIGSVFARPSTNKWYWSCRPEGTTKSATQCDAGCPTGTFYEGMKGYCAVDCPDWCPNIEGNQLSVAEYIRDDSGHCLLDGKIKYFRAKPDTAAVSCPGFWETQVGGGAYMDCSIGGTKVPASNQDIAGAVGRLLDTGKLHTLSCDVRLQEDNTLIKSLTAKTRCYRPGEIRED